MFFRKQSVRESNVNVRFGVEWREGVWHRCRPVRFHHCMQILTEDGSGDRRRRGTQSGRRGMRRVQEMDRVRKREGRRGRVG